MRNNLKYLSDNYNELSWKNVVQGLSEMRKTRDKIDMVDIKRRVNLTEDEVSRISSEGKTILKARYRISNSGGD